MQNNIKYLDVEVAYARSNSFGDQKVIRLKVSSFTSIKNIIEFSGMINLFSEINLSINKVGVFGKIKNLDDFVNNEDRIEIYKDLILDPNSSRKLKINKS